ncbi:MAG: hypothetical protein HC899_12930 [Leptolyngbyaceae cyanobacterium SM1_4_3]|nr:hypothetical protein [Leptolyngbyaceae cyanobacterium SM1_4_3]
MATCSGTSHSGLSRNQRGAVGGDRHESFDQPSRFSFTPALISPISNNGFWGQT